MRARVPVTFLAMLLALQTAAAWAAKSSPLEPVAAWSFNRCALDGDRILDSSRSGHDLVVGGAFCASGRSGLGLRFDGVDDIALSEPGILDFLQELTVSAWVYPERLSGLQTIVNKWYTLDSWMLLLSEDQFNCSLSFRGGRWGSSVSIETPATAGAWSHVACVFDGKKKKLSIYVNGRHRGTVATPGNQLQESTRPVAVGNHPSWNAFRGRIDEVALYEAALTADQVRSLASVDPGPYHGADTSVHPWLNEYPDGEENGYDVYLGRLGFSRYSCRIQDRYGRDILTRAPGDPAEKCIFFHEAATIARPERTYAYWYLVGPDHLDARRYDSAFAFGQAQADYLIEQWRTYRHLVGGRTLFADLERSLRGEDISGWGHCWPVENPADACERNQELLNGFIDAVVSSGLPITPGVYTSPAIWRDFFGDAYRPQDGAGVEQPFVVWLTGCSTTSGVRKQRSAAEVAAGLPIVEDSVLGGMRAVLWQHHIERPEYTSTSQNPSDGLSPVGAATSFLCSCDRLGGSCP